VCGARASGESGATGEPREGRMGRCRRGEEEPSREAWPRGVKKERGRNGASVFNGGHNHRGGRTTEEVDSLHSF